MPSTKALKQILLVAEIPIESAERNPRLVGNVDHLEGDIAVASQHASGARQETAARTPALGCGRDFGHLHRHSTDLHPICAPQFLGRRRLTLFTSHPPGGVAAAPGRPRESSRSRSCRDGSKKSKMIIKKNDITILIFDQDASTVGASGDIRGGVVNPGRRRERQMSEFPLGDPESSQSPRAAFPDTAAANRAERERRYRAMGWWSGERLCGRYSALARRFENRLAVADTTGRRLSHGMLWRESGRLAEKLAVGGIGRRRHRDPSSAEHRRRSGRVRRIAASRRHTRELADPHRSRNGRLRCPSDGRAGTGFIGAPRHRAAGETSPEKPPRTCEHGPGVFLFDDSVGRWWTAPANQGASLAGERSRPRATSCSRRARPAGPRPSCTATTPSPR